MAYFARVQALLADGRDIVSLATGELDTPTPAHVAAAGIAAIRDGDTRYTANNGTVELRRAIGQYLAQSQHLAFGPDQILVSNGSKQALFNVLFALCGPGDDVIIFAPYYPSYPEQVAMTGARPVMVPTRPNDYQIDPDALHRAMTERTRCIIVNSPNNPTGAVYDEDSLRAIAQAAADHDCRIISDEIYEQIVYAPATHRSIAAVSKQTAARTVVVGGVSKSYAMTGWRLGYAAGPKDIIDAAGLVQSHTTNNACSISQVAALTAFTTESDFHQTLLAGLLEKRERALTAVRSVHGVTCPAGEGAFYLFPNVERLLTQPTGDSSLDTSEALAHWLLETHGVAVVPGSAFGAEGCLRLSYAVSSERLEEGCRRLTKALETLP